MVAKVGDSIPSVDLKEGNPMNNVNLASEIAQGKAILVGVPAAFSPDCTETHVPGFINHPNLKGNKVYVIAVNDAFVMKAWAKHLDADSSSGIRFLADPAGEYTDKLGLMFDAEPYFGNKRGKRYAMWTEDGKITKIQIEEDPSKVTVAGAEHFL